MSYMTDERRMIQDSARQFAMKEVLPVANKLDPVEGEIPMSLRDKMATAKDFKNVQSIASFDDNRDAVLTEHQISVVQGQKWQLYTTFQ